MFDINNKEITEGAYIQIIGCKVKGDNGIYIVDRKYEGREEFCLYKVKQNGEQAKTKYNIYFLNDRNDKEKQVKIVSKEELKQAAKEVKAYVERRTAEEIVFTFSNAEDQTLQGLQEGKVIHFIKCVQWQGHINSQRGKYIISKIEKGGYRLHLLGAKGDKIADNVNGYYQFTPIHLNLKADTMQKLLDEKYIEILNRTESTKGEIETTNSEQAQKNTNEEKSEQKESKKEIASLCYGCKNFNSNNKWSCKGMEAVYTGCVCYNKDSVLPTIEIGTEQPSAEQTQKADTEYKPMTERTEAETITEKQQENTNNSTAAECHIINEQNTEQKQEQHTITIKAVYYPINEASARTAKTINSFYDYVDNEATNAYKAHIAQVETLAQQKAEQHPERAGDIQVLLNKYSKKYAEWKNRYYAIECMCPSVMVCGAGNFPVRKKEKQVAAWDRLYATWDSIENIKTQILRVGTGRDAIKSDDENAIEKLEIKLKKAQDLQTYMKKVNAYYRKHKTCKGCDGVNDETANKLDESMKSEYTWGTAPFPSFRLTNNNAKIKNTKNRLARLQAAKSKPTEEIATLENDYCKVVENTEIMRIQLIFDGKPDAEVRKILKSNGFRWAPSQGAWQRQLTSNGKYATKQVLTELKSVVA